MLDSSVRTQKTWRTKAGLDFEIISSTKIAFPSIPFGTDDDNPRYKDFRVNEDSVESLCMRVLGLHDEGGNLLWNAEGGNMGHKMACVIAGVDLYKVLPPADPKDETSVG